MSESGICCETCFKKISKRSDKAAYLWLTLCEIQKDTNLFGLTNKDFPALRTLEIMGYILTSETDELIMIRVLGQQEDNDGVFFCGCSDE